MGEADHAALPLAHLKIGRSQLGQSPMSLVPGIILLAQPQQADVAAVARREAGHFDVVAQQIIRRGQRMDLALEIAFLVIPARSPAQAAADVEILAEHMPHHVFRRDALGRAS